MVDSPKCASYAEQPEMSAPGITQKLLPELAKDYSFVALNFANLDLVGHSGNYAATVKAVETIDSCLAQIVPTALANGYTILITGDHGNAEYMVYDHSINPLDDPALDGSPCPSHTRNPVPLIVIAETPHTLKTPGGLKDLAPTILSLLKLPIPPEMTGKSLL